MVRRSGQMYRARMVQNYSENLLTNPVTMSINTCVYISCGIIQLYMERAEMLDAIVQDVGTALVNVEKGSAITSTHWLPFIVLESSSTMSFATNSSGPSAVNNCRGHRCLFDGFVWDAIVAVSQLYTRRLPCVANSVFFSYCLTYVFHLDDRQKQDDAHGKVEVLVETRQSFQYFSINRRCVGWKSRFCRSYTSMENILRQTILGDSTNFSLVCK